MVKRVPTPSNAMQIDLYNDKSLNRSPGVNWVEAAGGLPPNVRARARAIKRKNPSWSLSRCIATAINANKYSESADDTFFPGEQRQRRTKRAGHIKANRQWEALKGRKNMANFPAKKKKVPPNKDQAATFGKKPDPNDPNAAKKSAPGAAKPGNDPLAAAQKEKDPKKRAKLLAALKKRQKSGNVKAAGKGLPPGKGKPMNFAKKQTEGKEGAASDGNRSDGALSKTIAAYKKKKAKMSPGQRKKVEARLKSSQQQLGKKVGLSNSESANVDLAGSPNTTIKRPSVLGQTGKTASQPRQYGGKFGLKAGSGPKGSSGTTSGSASTRVLEPVTPAQIAAGVSKLAVGQAITLPGGNGKVKRLSNGYQVVKMDGTFNKVFQGQSQAVLAANRLIGGRRAKDTELKKTGGTTNPGKATV